MFAGAGISAQAMTENGNRLPMWSELLEQIVNWCIENRVDLCADKSEYVDIIKKKRFLLAAQELQERLGPRLSACLSDILYSGRIQPSEAHYLIWSSARKTSKKRLAK